ncbi:MAG: hypothetical protein H0U46_10840 [Actinobacteria bacterium]|nr:hypothetical protein [Actinomycetota bacterium]
MDRGEQLIFRVSSELKAAIDADALEKQTNKTVLLNRILSKRYRIPYEPGVASIRRKTPFGGGPKAAEDAA